MAELTRNEHKLESLNRRTGEELFEVVLLARGLCRFSENSRNFSKRPWGPSLNCLNVRLRDGHPMIFNFLLDMSLQR